jgi:hypothetical protein
MRKTYNVIRLFLDKIFLLTIGALLITITGRKHLFGTHVLPPDANPTQLEKVVYFCLLSYKKFPEF